MALGAPISPILAAAIREGLLHARFWGVASYPTEHHSGVGTVLGARSHELSPFSCDWNTGRMSCRLAAGLFLSV